MLAACGTPAEIQNASSLTEALPAERAFVLPDPGGPAVLSVTERRYGNAVEQRIFLETNAQTPGQNHFSVQLYGPVDWRTSGRSTLPSQGFLPPTNWRTEARAVMPGVALRPSPYFVRNRYGPFGYAMARGQGSDLCMYGWQTISAAGNSRNLFRNGGAVQIRLRFCRMGASEESLLRMMYSYTMTSFFRDFAWNPLGTPLEAEVAERGDVYPTGDLGLARIVPEGPRAVPRATAPRRSRPAVSTQPQESVPPPAVPAPIGPRVPLPPGAAAPANVQPVSGDAVPGTSSVRVPLPPA